MTGDPAHDQFYEPPMVPYRPTRVRATPVLVVLIMLVGTIVGAYYLAKRAGWLEPRSPLQTVGTQDGIGIKSRITYPAEPPQLTSVNHRDLTQEQLDAMRRELEAQRKLLEAHMASKHGATTAPAPAPAAAKPPPKKHLTRVSYERKEPVTDTSDHATELFAGTFLPAVMESRLNSDRPGVAVARIREQVRDSRTGRGVLIPQGSLITMRYDSNLLYGDERVEVRLDKLTLPTGREIEFPREPVSDQIGQSGLTGEIDRHLKSLFIAILLRGVLRGGAQAVQTQITSAGNGVGAVAGGIVQEGAQVGQQQTQPYIRTAPTIIIPDGEPVNIVLTKAVALPVYHEPMHALR